MDRDTRHLEQILAAFECADPSTRELLRDSTMDEIRYIFQESSIDFLKTGLAKFTEIEEYEWCDKIKTLINEKKQTPTKTKRRREPKKIGH
jgi:hypothetical protein